MFEVLSEDRASFFFYDRDYNEIFEPDIYESLSVRKQIFSGRSVISRHW